MRNNTSRIFAWVVTIAMLFTTFGSDIASIKIFAEDVAVAPVEEAAPAADPAPAQEEAPVDNPAPVEEPVQEPVVEEPAPEPVPVEEPVQDPTQVPAEETPQEVPSEPAAPNAESGEQPPAEVSSDNAAELTTNVTEGTKDPTIEGGIEAEDASDAATSASSEEIAADAATTASTIVEEKEPEKEIQFSAKEFQGSAGGVTVSVKADEGAFPDGTEMSVSYVDYSTRESIKENASQQLGADTEVVDIVAVDITFTYEGNEIQPTDNSKVHVSLSTRTVSGENHEVIHVSDNGSIDQIQGAGSNGAEFESRGFSIYAIIGTDGVDEDGRDEVRLTYEFYNDDNALLYSQIVITGDTLTKPEDPSSTLGTKVFEGWYTEGGEAFTGFGTVDTSEYEEDTTIKIYAQYKAIYTITLYGEEIDGNRVVASVIKVVVDENTDIDISEVKITPSESGYKFVGWSEDESATTATYTKKIAQVNGDMALYPVVLKAYWVHFDENDVALGNGASYTPAIYVLEGETAADQLPPDPQFKGYKFTGWYREAEAVNLFDLENTSITENITLYAGWEADQTTYTVIIWKQSVNDDKDASEKTYDYETSESRTALVGETVNPTTNDKGHEYVGFRFGSADENVEVKADGSTIINVYYDRITVTISFYKGNNPTYYNVGNSRVLAVMKGQWNNVNNYTGLYGQTFAKYGYTWPKDENWKEEKTAAKSGNTNIEYPSGTTQTILTQFVVNPTGDTDSVDEHGNITYTLYSVSDAGNSTVYHYVEKVDSTNPNNANNYQLMAETNSSASGTFYFSNKFNGFGVYAYKKGNNGTFTKINGAASIEYSGNLYIYHTRNKYDLTFLNGSAEHVVDTLKVPYEATLGNISGKPDYSSLTYPGNSNEAEYYECVGWFADPECTTYVSFTALTDEEKAELKENWEINSFTTYSEMPCNNLVVYAGWKKKWFKVRLDGNGGTIPAEQVSRDFWIEYSKTVDDTHLSRTTRDGYVLAGWYEVDYNETSDKYTYDKPWDFENGVTHYMKLIAKWLTTSALTVEYDAAEGSGAPEDTKEYNDGAVTIVKAATTAPEGSVFAGYIIKNDNSGKIYMPGEKFTVSSEYAEGNVVTLVAQYSELTKEKTSITFYANNGTTDYETVEFEVNSEIKTLPANKYTNGNLVFIEWNTKADGTGEGYEANRSISANNKEVPNRLYAVWSIAVEITIPDQERVYNAQAQEYNIAEVTVNGLPDNYTYTVEWKDVAVSATDVAEGTIPVTLALLDITIKNNAFKIIQPTITEVTEGTFKITPIKLTVKTEGASKSYDGQPLTNEEASISSLLAADEDKAEITATGSQLNAGSSTNTYILTWTDETVAQNYTVTTEELGTLEVKQLKVKLTSASDSKPYDGTPLTNDHVDIEGDPIVEGEITDIKATGSVTYVSEGEVDNTVKYTTGENFLADNYDITVVEGKLKITDRSNKYSITVTSFGGTAQYDGNEKYVEGYGVSVDETEYSLLDTITDIFATLTASAADNVTEEGDPSKTFTINGIAYEISGLEAGATGIEVGTYPAEFVGTAQITEVETGEDVTAQFTINRVIGNLEITPAGGTDPTPDPTPTPTPTPTPDPTPTPGPTPDPTPTPTPVVIVPTPTPLAAVPVAAGDVLGASRDQLVSRASVLGARRGRTDDTTNTSLRLMIILACAISATFLLTIGRLKRR